MGDERDDGVDGLVAEGGFAGDADLLVDVDGVVSVCVRFGPAWGKDELGQSYWMAETPVIWTEAWIAQQRKSRRKEDRFVNSST